MLLDEYAEYEQIMQNKLVKARKITEDSLDTGR